MTDAWEMKINALWDRFDAGDDVDDAVTAFYALALAEAGREREVLSLSLGARSAHLPRYGRALSAYAQLLVTDRGADE